MTDTSAPKTATATKAEVAPAATGQGPDITAPLYAAIVTLGEAIQKLVSGVTAEDQDAISAEVSSTIAAAKQQLAK